MFGSAILTDASAPVIPKFLNNVPLVLGRTLKETLVGSDDPKSSAKLKKDVCATSNLFVLPPELYSILFGSEIDL